MSYVKTVWETGDVITAEKLNNIEGGIEGATPLILTETVDGFGNIYTLSETAGTIKAAFDSGRVVLLIHEQTLSGGMHVPILLAGKAINDSYFVSVFDTDNGYIDYHAATSSDYPVFTIE